MKKNKRTFKEFLSDIGPYILLYVVLPAIFIAPIILVIALNIPQNFNSFFNGLKSLIISAVLFIAIFFGPRIFERIKPLFSHKERFFNKCKKVIDKYPDSSIGATSCDKIITNEIERRYENSYFKNNFTDKQIYTLLANISFDIISTGAYNLHRGVIGNMGPGPSLCALHDGCMRWLLYNGYITQEEFDLQLKELKSNILASG